MTTATEAKRTPGPWETSCNDREWWDVCGPDGDMIANLEACDNSEANAAFIVRACNAHDELVAALRQVVNMHAFKSDDMLLYRDLTGAMDMARAALKSIAAQSDKRAEE